MDHDPRKRAKLGAFRNQLKYYHNNIDIIKFTSGIGLIDPAIEEKISACKEYGIDVYFGEHSF
ncbi:MAG: phosphosulfolactate synthase [Saprospiraceae bacterium]